MTLQQNIHIGIAMVKPWKKSFGKAIALAFVAVEVEGEAGVTGTTAELACLKMYLPLIVPTIHLVPFASALLICYL